MELSLSFDPRLTPAKQIRNLLVILSGGAACAILLTLFLLYNYSPEGHYLIKNALLSPDVIAQISLDKKKGKQEAVFDKIEYSYQDIETKKRTAVPIDKATYAKFYNMISNDKSLLDIPADIAAAFNQMPVSSLTIHDNAQQIQIFQEVQFLYKGDYYRLQLRESAASNWIYFYHPHIYEDAFNLFTGLKS